jgi:antitoxin component YwqK of YwqJK toxin-antitoxin module
MKQTLILLFAILSSGLNAQDINNWAEPDTLLDDSGRILCIVESGEENRSLNYEYSHDGLLQKEIFGTWVDKTQYERITEYHHNGKIKVRYFWYILNKKFYGKSSLDGVYSEYDAQEILLKSIEYHNNKINGVYVNYYPNGKIKTTTEYISDNRNGKEITYFTNGQIASELLYQEDKLISAKYFNKEGVEFENKEFTHGEGKLIFYEFGELKGYCFFKKGKSKKCNCDCN